MEVYVVVRVEYDFAESDCGCTCDTRSVTGVYSTWQAALDAIRGSLEGEKVEYLDLGSMSWELGVTVAKTFTAEHEIQKFQVVG